MAYLREQYTHGKISQIETQDVHCALHLNVGNSFTEDNNLGADRNFSQIVLSNNECSSSPNTYEKSSSFQLMSAQSSCVDANTSQDFFSNKLKSIDSRMHNAPFVLPSQCTDITKNKKGRQKKSPHLPHNDNSKEPVRKKLKSSSSFKKTKHISVEFDVDFNAHEFAIEMGFEKPHEKITIRSSGIDKEEEITKQISPVEIIQQVIDYRKSCKCSCLNDLSMRDIASHRLEITLLDRHSRDFFIMGLLRCGAVTIKETCRHNNRIRNRFNYRLMNTRICHCCFLAVNNIGGKYLKNLKKHFADHGVTSRLHGNLGRKPYHAINNSDIKDVVEFVNRYASSYGVPAVKRPKNSKTKHIIRLPPLDNVTSVHKKYKEMNEQSGKRAIALTSFRKIWSHHLPHIKLTIKEFVSPVNSLPNSIDLHKPVPNVDCHTDHSTLKQMLKTERTNQSIDTATRSPDMQTAASQETLVSLPHEYSSGEMSRNQIMSLNMYLNDGDNHDALQYGYIFSQSYEPMAQHLQTHTSSTTPLSSIPMSNETSDSHVSPNNVQHPPFPGTEISSAKHMVLPDTCNSSTDKHLLFSPNSSLDANSNHLHPAFTHASFTANADPDVHQQTTSHIESSLTNLSQQIHLSLMQ